VSVDQDGVRAVLVGQQRLGEGRLEFADPAGLVLTSEHGQLVEKDEPIAEARATDHEAAYDLAAQLRGCFRVLDRPPSITRAPEIVANG
jgi:hypothetical protein